MLQKYSFFSIYTKYFVKCFLNFIIKSLRMLSNYLLRLFASPEKLFINQLKINP